MARRSQAERIHSRLSQDLPINSRVAIAIVDDPLGTVLGEKIQVTRSIRDDPLGGMYARGQITKPQFDNGRNFQYYCEQSQIGGIQAMDPRKPVVDGGKPMDPIHASQMNATDKLNQARAVLGVAGSVLLFDVLMKRKSITQAAVDRGLTSNAEIKFIGKRFRECLDTLDDVF